MRRRILLLCTASSLTLAGFALGGLGCGPDEPDTPEPNGGEGSGDRVHGLTSEQAEQTLARIGETEITVGEFAAELASKGSFIRTRYNSPERRREFLDQMIRFELLALEAQRRGYDDLPEVQRTRKQMMIRRFLEERFETGGPESLTEEDVRAYYEEHESEFNTPAQVRASHIVMRDRAAAERVLRELLAAPNDLRLYRRLAEQHNTDEATRDRFGDLRFFSRPADRAEGDPEVPEAVANAAFEIERIGGLHGELVQTSAGFHIIKLTGRRAAMNRSLEEADRPIRNRLWRERRETAIQTLIDELRAESDVEENFDVLSDIQIDIPEGDFPTGNVPNVPGGPTDAIRRPAPSPEAAPVQRRRPAPTPNAPEEE